MENRSSIEKETRFINLLGYHLEECKAFGCWNILDNDDNNYGYLNTDGKKYEVKLDSPTIYYEDHGSIDIWNNKTFEYEVKNKYRIGFTLTSERVGLHGREMFIDNDRMHLKIMLTYGGISIVYFIRDQEEEYEYILSFDYDREYDYIEEHTTHRGKEDVVEKKGFYGDQYFCKYTNPNHTRVNVCHYINGVEIDNIPSYIHENNVSDLSIKHHKGIELFTRIREVVNDILPFKEDALYEIFDFKTIYNEKITHFFPDYDFSKCEENEKTR